MEERVLWAALGSRFYYTLRLAFLGRTRGQFVAGKTRTIGMERVV
jgi:hypothetical protein